MASIRLVQPTVLINNISVLYVPNSFEVNPGFGEQKVSTVSAGGGLVDVVYSKDVTKNYSTVKFEMAFVDGVDKMVETWKENGNNNSVSITDGETSLFISNAALTNDVMYPFGTDKHISLEFNGDPVS